MRLRSKAVSLPLGLAVLLGAALTWGWFTGEGTLLPTAYAADGKVTQGTLVSLDDHGQPAYECPLEHTDVKADISGFLARVTVTQKFVNTAEDKIEAVYTFPLPQNAAVDDMTIRIGERTVKGKIKEKDEARRIYEQAKSQGHVAALLDQERPNIFTQSVANIEPGAKIEVEISYVETLKYEEGTYAFAFPMVVGPRYMPGQATGKQGGGWAPDTTEVPDASKISPPVTPPGTRAGHDISVEVSVDAGVPIQALASKSHDVETARPDSRQAVVRLTKKREIPNKDFLLTYKVAGKGVEDAILTHHDGKSGYFSLILQPPERVTAEDVTPKELVFVIDTSGSMSGFPIEKAKETMKLALDGLYPRDTFNLITFAGTTKVLFEKPVAATAVNLRTAQQFLSSQRGGGGTEMMRAIRTALAPSDSQEHVRIVCFMTDGYIGNDMAILGEIQKHPNARIFSFGIGNSVNRFLLDKMAKEGRGEVEYVSLQDDGSAAARRFHERVRNPLLTDIEIDWGGHEVADIYPSRIPDLFSAKPVYLTGRYVDGGSKTIRLKGNMAGKPFVREIPVRFEEQPGHDVMATLWARTRVDDLMRKDWQGLQTGTAKSEVKEEIIRLGIDYRLMTQFTSFVAVEETIVTEGGKARRVEVPVEMPDGVSYEGVFGERENAQMAQARFRTRRAFSSAPQGHGYIKPSPAAGGSLGGSVGGIVSADAMAPVEKDARLQLPQPESTPARNETPADARAKLHTLLQSILNKHGDPSASFTAAEQALIRDGKVHVEVWLAGGGAQKLAALQQLGFALSEPQKVANIAIGWVSLEQLESLAGLASVRQVAPHRP